MLRGVRKGADKGNIVTIIVQDDFVDLSRVNQES